MIFKELRYLLVLERERSISRSAQVLYMSQPSLGQFLNNIERELGFTIFERTSQGIFPTEKGKEYINLIEEIVNSYDHQMLTMQEKNNLSDFHLGIGDQRGAIVLPYIICKASERLPHVRLRINDGFAEKSKLFEAFERKELDMICVSTFSMAKENVNPQAEYYTLAEEEILLAIPKNNLLLEKVKSSLTNDKKWIDVQHINQQPFILCSSRRGLGQISRRILEKRKIQANILHDSTNISTVLASCISCNALSLISQGYARYDLPLEYVSLGQQGYFWTHLAVCRKDTNFAPIINELVSILQESFRDSISKR